VSKMKLNEWCGVPYCYAKAITKGLCATHYKDHKAIGLHQDVVANTEITRDFLKPRTFARSTLVQKHRKFARTLPIPKHQQLALTKALNATALRQGVVK